MTNIKILIADNQALTREGIKSLIGEIDGFEVISEVESGMELPGEIGKLKPDLIIIDFQLPGYFSIDDIAAIYAGNPRAKVLVVSTSKNKDDILKAIGYGVNNYILKLCDKEEFINALYATARQERFFCGKVIDAIVEKQFPKTISCDGVSLSDREVEIVQLIAEGLTNGQIAERLFISIHTVSTHRKNILRKLDLNKSSELIMYAIRRGLVKAA